MCVRATAASAPIVLMNLLRFLRNLHATLPLQGPVAEWGWEGDKGQSCSALVCHCIKMTQSERVEAAPTGNVGHFTWPSKRRSARKLLIENKLHFNLL